MPKKETKVQKQKKHKTIFNFVNVVFLLIVSLILSNAILVAINFERLSNDQSPYFFTKVSAAIPINKEGHFRYYYSQGLFKIINDVDGNKETWTLKLFFLN